MISLIGVYHVVESIIPLYVAMIVGYAFVKWWKIFTPVECTGINMLVSKLCIPLLSFRVISTNNPYHMNLKLILSDTLQKVFALILLAVFSKITYTRRSSNSFDFVITGFPLTTLPNTLIVGIPVLKVMYGDGAAGLLAQIVVLQSVVWYNLLLFLFELRAARALSSVKTTPLETRDLKKVTQQMDKPNVGDKAEDRTLRLTSTTLETGDLEEVAQQNDMPNVLRDKAKVITPRVTGTTLEMEEELEEIIQQTDQPEQYDKAKDGTTTVTNTSIIIEELEVTQRTDQSNPKNEAEAGYPMVDTKHILLKVGKKLIVNPNTHAAYIGLIWSMISFRWGLKLPVIVEKSISILADGGLGMAMFSIGIFMASQASILTCQTWLAFLSTAARFLLGPGLMAVASFAFGLKSTLFKIAIVQAAVPTGVFPFVFAKEYNIHPNIVSTTIILGMVMAIPVTLAYYFLLELS